LGVKDRRSTIDIGTTTLTLLKDKLA